MQSSVLIFFLVKCTTALAPWQNGWRRNGGGFGGNNNNGNRDGFGEGWWRSPRGILFLVVGSQQEKLVRNVHRVLMRCAVPVSATVSLAGTAMAAPYGDDEEDDEYFDDEGIPGGGGTRLRRKLSDFTVRERLAAIPVFYVANARGSPYLLNRVKEGVQECLIFMDPLDAEQLLSEMCQASPQLTDARIFCTSMDRAMNLLQRKPTPTGNLDARGRELLLRYRIQPSEREVEIASKKIGNKAQNIVPCYVSEQLEYRKGGTTVVPVFLSSDDLIDAWREATSKVGVSSKQPKYKV